MVGRRLGALIAAAVVLGLLGWYLLPRWTASTSATRAPSASTSSPVGGSSPAGSAASLAPAATARSGSAVVPSSADEATPRPGASVHARKIFGDTIDPCLQAMPPEIPAGFQTLAAAGVTVAWDPEVAIEPTSLAYTTAGLLAQIGLVTGTAPRGDIVVIVYPSLDDFRAKTGAPTWSEGTYDGAVRIPAAKAEFGIRIHTLRHELVHAQLHATVGCMPIWLNEGAAQYFANTAPDRTWFHMLKTKSGVDLREMQASVVEDVHAEPADVYAQSLAMILYVFARGDSLADLAHDRGGPATELWARRYPTASQADVLDAVAHRVFGIGQGADLDAILGGQICCHGQYTLSELACHGAPREKGELCRTLD